MPIYDYLCIFCGKKHEKFDSVGNKRTKIKCGCGHFAKSVISTTSKAIVMEGWIDGIQAYVTGPAHHKRILKEKQMSER